MMKYFKNKTGDVFAYTRIQLDVVAQIDNKDYEFDIPQAFYNMKENLKEMTELKGAELEDHLNPSPTTEQFASSVRHERDEALKALDEVVSNPLRFNELSEEQRLEAASYRKLLLDVPQQKCFPTTYEMPKAPSWLS